MSLIPYRKHNPKLSDLLAPLVVRYDERWTQPQHYGALATHVLRKRRPRFARISHLLDRRPGLCRGIIKLPKE